MNRCEWAGTGDPFMLQYHDDEWGLPSRDEGHVLEMLLLEGAQAGLAWSTILRKREGYRRAYAGFDARVIAAFGPDDVARLLADAGIVRNRLKIASSISNARAVLALHDVGTSLAGHLWSFVDGRPIQNRWQRLGEIPAETAESQALSRDLRGRGFRFVGPTICYALMQSIGMVNDHTVGCDRWREVGGPG